MNKINKHFHNKRNCVVCGHRTLSGKSWSYKDGIEINVPVCENCKSSMGFCLDLAMDAHLKSIAQSVRMSQIITCDEKHIDELHRQYCTRG